LPASSAKSLRKFKNCGLLKKADLDGLGIFTSLLVLSSFSLIL